MLETGVNNERGKRLDLLLFDLVKDYNYYCIL